VSITFRSFSFSGVISSRFSLRTARSASLPGVIDPLRFSSTFLVTAPYIPGRGLQETTGESELNATLIPLRLNESVGKSRFNLSCENE